MKEMQARIEVLENNDPVKQPLPIETKTTTNKKVVTTSPPSATHQNKEVDSVDWEKFLFQIWLPRVFIFVFIIGVLWGFKAASDYGLMNETVKVTLGFIVSSLLLLIGQQQMENNREKLGYVLLGGAVPLLMLTTFAMHVLYSMVGPSLAFMLNVSWIAVGLWLTKKHRSEVLGFISMVGGVLVPFLIESETPNMYVFLGYETLLYVLFLFLSAKFQFKVIYYGSTILLNLALFVFYISSYIFVEDKFATEYYVAFPILIQHGCLLYFYIKEKKQIDQHASMVFASLLVTSAWVYSTFSEHWISLFFAMVAVMYVLLLIKYQQDVKKRPIFLTNVIIALTFLILHAVNEDLQMSFLLIEGLAAYYVSLKYGNDLSKGIAILVYVFTGLVLIATEVITTPLSNETVNWLIFLTTFVLGMSITYQLHASMREQTLKYGSVLLTILVLIFSTELTMAVVEGWSDNKQRLAVNVVWIGLAVVTIAIGLKKTFNYAKYIGVSLLILTLLKMVLYDMPYIPLAIRAGLFIALGFVGLVVSRTFYKKK
ncbi:DUF2339 domain-containing protein [Bacillus sp. FJAT-42315]|uniref:DUF2339 domain-containing protein n=1 Tax=Bacillus sp. FJAT-42315 TaxID=2014077 RepID=UPI000C239F8B|nr:DUF2339 domain-containing protein [Bacillus sp. FJAT-42315]